MEPIRTCLEHRHSYVRRNAVCAIYTIYQNFPQLISDAPEVIFEFLQNEKDASCKRNAFMMLIQAVFSKRINSYYFEFDKFRLKCIVGD